MFGDWDGVFETLFFLSAVGLIAIVCSIGYGLWWLFNHVSFV